MWGTNWGKNWGMKYMDHDLMSVLFIYMVVDISTTVWVLVYNLLCYSIIGSMIEKREVNIMAKKIKCPGFLCGSTDVEYLGGN